MGLTRLTKKLMPNLEDIDAVILVVNVSDPQFATLGVFYSAIEHLSHFTVLNKTDMVSKSRVRGITTKLRGEVIAACMIDGRGIEEIKYRLAQWKPKSNVLVLGVFNSGKTSLINRLANIEEKVGDIPGTTLEFKRHNYDGKVLIDSIGQVTDIFKPRMVSIDLSGCTDLEGRLRTCLLQDIKGITESVESSIKGLKDAAIVIINQVSKGGKVITCGAGASALVAMEIAGQGQETGLPVMCFTNNFVDAQPISFAKGAYENERAMAEYFARAVNSEDVVIGVSASGGTAFVFTLLELARGKGAKTIALTENSDTPLGKAADIIIKSEAKPEGASSGPVQTAHLAIGHALILTVADLRGIDADTAVQYMMEDKMENKAMGIK